MHLGVRLLCSYNVKFNVKTINMYAMYMEMTLPNVKHSKNQVSNPLFNKPAE